MKVKKTKITWKKVTYRFGTKIIYKNLLIKHKRYLSISTTMYIGNEVKRTELVFVPMKVLKKVKELKDEPNG